MKCVSYFFYATLFFLISSTYSADFFQLEHLPQGTKIPVLKLVNLIPAVANTPIKNAELQDVYVQAVTETPAVNAHIEMLGKMKLKTSLPGLQNIGDLDLTFIAKLFSAFGRGAAPLSALPIDNELSKTALAIFSEVPKGFTRYDGFENYKNIYSEDVVGKDKNPHMILQVRDKYVMFAPEAFDLSSLPEQQLKQFIDEMPNTPTWKKLITAPKKSVAQVEREEDLEKTTKGLEKASVSPEQQAEAIEAEVKRLEEQLARPGQSDEAIKQIRERAKELKTQVQTIRYGQQVEAIEAEVKRLEEELARPGQSDEAIKQIGERARELKTQVQTIRIPVSTTEPQQAPPTQLPQLTELPPVLKELQEQYDLYIDVLKDPRRRQTSETPETQELLIKRATEEKATIGKQGYTADVLAELMTYLSKQTPQEKIELQRELEKTYQKKLSEALSISPKEASKTPAPTTIPTQAQPTRAMKELQQIYDKFLNELNTKTHQTPEGQELAARLATERNAIGTSEYKADAYTDFLLYQAAAPIRLRQDIIQDTITALEKLPQNNVTTSLITRLKSERETLGARIKNENETVLTLSTLPKESATLEEARGILKRTALAQLPPLPSLEIDRAKEEANAALEQLNSIPKKFQTDIIRNAIANLQDEIKKLDLSKPTELRDLAEAMMRAKKIIAEVTPSKPIPSQAKVPPKEQPATTKERIKEELAVAKKELTAIKEKVVTTAERAKQTIAALPGQAKEKIVSAKEKATALAQDIQKEYATIRKKLNLQINILNKIISERTSEITRVGAALFLITLQNPNYRPFQNIKLPDLPPVDVPGIKDIELNNTELGVFLAPPQVFSIWAQGTGRVINIPLLAKVLFNYERMQDPTTKKMVDNTGVVLQAGLPEAWKFSDSFPEMKSFDRLVIKRAYVYVSTINYIDYTIQTQLMPAPSIAIANVPGRPTVGMLPGIAIRPGLSLYGEINLRKLIPEIFDHLNFAGLETASLYGTISNKPENCQIGIGLPDLIKIENSPFKLGGVWAEIHAKNLPGIGFEPEVSVVIAIVIQPSPKDETLTFTARGSSDAVSGIVAFSMQGFWNNALGIEGLSIGDLAIQLHADYKAVLSGIPITGFGFTGTIKFGTQVDSPIIRFASLYAMTSAGQEVAVQGKLDGTISIWQIIDGCKSLAIKKAQQDKKSTQPVEDNYNKILNNAVAKQFGNIAIRNVDMKVAPSTVRIGEFFILQGFTAKGELTLLGVTAGMEFNLGQSGLTATGYLSPIKIGDVFSLTGAGMDKQYGTPDDGATMSLALNFLKQHFIITGQVKLLGIEQQTDIFVDTEGLNCTISGKLFNLFDASVVLKSRGDITNPDLYFKASMKQQFTTFLIDETVKALRASTKDSVDKITNAQKDLDKLNANVADLEGQINSRKKRIDELSPNFLEGVKNSPEITKLGIEIGGLETGKAGAIATRETAKGILEGAKGIVGGSSILVEALVKGSIVLDIRESTIEASVQDIAKGRLPRFTATVSVLGKKLNLDMQLDFSSPEKAQQSANAIAQQILALFK